MNGLVCRPRIEHGGGDAFPRPRARVHYRGPDASGAGFGILRPKQRNRARHEWRRRARSTHGVRLAIRSEAGDILPRSTDTAAADGAAEIGVAERPALTGAIALLWSE